MYMLYHYKWCLTETSVRHAHVHTHKRTKTLPAKFKKANWPCLRLRFTSRHLVDLFGGEAVAQRLVRRGGRRCPDLRRGLVVTDRLFKLEALLRARTAHGVRDEALVENGRRILSLLAFLQLRHPCLDKSL